MKKYAGFFSFKTEILQESTYQNIKLFNDSLHAINNESIKRKSDNNMTLKRFRALYYCIQNKWEHKAQTFPSVL